MDNDYPSPMYCCGDGNALVCNNDVWEEESCPAVGEMCSELKCI